MTANKDKLQPEAAVEIAGAGPAGLAAAITLAQAGRRVVVHEMQKEVGRRFGGDFQQALPLLIAEGCAADQGTVDMLAALFIPVKIQTNINIAQLPAFALGIHAQGNRGTGTEPGQQ